MFCRKCGNEMCKKYCSSCGFSLSEDEKPMVSKIVAATLRRKWINKDNKPVDTMVEEPVSIKTEDLNTRTKRFKEFYAMLSERRS